MYDVYICICNTNNDNANNTNNNPRTLVFARSIEHGASHVTGLLARPHPHSLFSRRCCKGRTLDLSLCL